MPKRNATIVKIVPPKSLDKKESGTTNKNQVNITTETKNIFRVLMIKMLLGFIFYFNTFLFWCPRPRFELGFRPSLRAFSRVSPRGIEPRFQPSEGYALSIELWGLYACYLTLISRYFANIRLSYNR